MPYLDAALAFALTMLVVATVVSQIVRLMRNTAKLRNEELKKMLKEYFDVELAPVIKRELNRLNKEIKAKAAAELKEKAEALNVTDLFTAEELDKLVSVSTEELMELLKRSTLGAQLLEELGDKAKTVFDELGKRYEMVGNKFTEMFREGSRKWATVIALLLALIFNIDSIYIAQSYVNNEGLRQSVIDQRDAFVEDYDNLIDSLEQDENKDSVSVEELKEAFQDSQEQVDVLTSAGFPIGWSYFPHAYFQAEPSQDFENRNDLLGWLTWLLGIAFTAGLAGLGSPFWYDAVTGISHAVQSVRAGKK